MQVVAAVWLHRCDRSVSFHLLKLHAERRVLPTDALQFGGHVWIRLDKRRHVGRESSPIALVEVGIRSPGDDLPSPRHRVDLRKVLDQDVFED